ncbi:MAG TPA: PQQ-dependent sugar dehydrogenase [Pyrinomonadaceae bacterium]|nr:PQQ-dependent sugar dehydrogenase [Pyrinomonadaceae bacterium]
MSFRSSVLSLPRSKTNFVARCFRLTAFAALVLARASLFGGSLEVHAATLPANFTETLLTSGLTNPTAMAFAPDGRLFVCQQGGELRVVTAGGTLLATPFVSLTVDQNGERGLLGVAFDPAFSTNGFVYVYYTATTPQTHNRVSRFTASTANPDVAAAGSEVTILDLNNLSGATNHNGGAIHFGPDAKLYIAVGENANTANSQSIGNLLGKILRINSDGTIPGDNPTTFPGIGGSTSGNNRAIWSVGLRNPYTFTFQSTTGRMFINDVGQNVWEEINDGIAGSNYGWSICEGFCSPPNANLRDPLFRYGHGSSSTTGCAITGGAFYNPTTANFPSDYVGKYFYAEFCTGWIRRFDPATSTDTAFATNISNPVDLIVTADGSLYYLARGAGSVFRVRYNGPTDTLGTVSGRITNSSNGNGVAGVVVRLTGTQNRKTITDTNGNYSFDSVQTGGVYNLSPSRANFSFNPSSRSLGQLGNNTDAPFSAIFAGTTLNPLDTPEFFVRQHYVDFLNREPDESGFNFWSDQIINCGADTTCLERKRVNVSAAYFLSIEFQQTGGLVNELYRTSFDRRPFYSEFVPDSQTVGLGVVVGRTGWEQLLENNKQAFVSAWVQRSAFVNAYGGLSNDAYVDTLISHTGVTFTAGERNALVNSLVNQTATRAQVLRQIAEDSRFISLKFNETFVMMEYFGYLRRDPDTAGFNFWLGKLNQFNGNFEQADMVKAFIVSGEYRDRFPQ